MKPSWMRPSIGEWEWADFIEREHRDAVLMDLGFCPECGAGTKPCACEVENG